MPVLRMAQHVCVCLQQQRAHEPHGLFAFWLRVSGHPHPLCAGEMMDREGHAQSAPA